MLFACLCSVFTRAENCLTLETKVKRRRKQNKYLHGCAKMMPLHHVNELISHFIAFFLGVFLFQMKISAIVNFPSFCFPKIRFFPRARLLFHSTTINFFCSFAAQFEEFANAAEYFGFEFLNCWHFRFCFIRSHTDDA